MDKYRLIVNPTSDQGATAGKIPFIKQQLDQHAVSYEMVLTERVKHAWELAARAATDGYTGVIAAGGDGTVNEVINGLMEVKTSGNKIPCLGVIPVGRGNDFACGVNIPADVEEACRIIAGGRTKAMDVGKITGGFFPDGRFFGNGIGIGFDTIVGLEAAKMKRVHGFLAYVIGALKTLILFPKAPEIEISFNGTTIRQQATQVSIMNGKRMGGAFYMAPAASSHDGKFNILLSAKLSRLELFRMIFMVIKGMVVKHPKLLTDLADHFVIHSGNGGLVTHADGETVCTDGKKLLIECLPAQIEIITTKLQKEAI